MELLYLLIILIQRFKATVYRIIPILCLISLIFILGFLFDVIAERAIIYSVVGTLGAIFFCTIMVTLNVMRLFVLSKSASASDQMNSRIYWLLKKLYSWQQHFASVVYIFDIIPRISVLTGFLIDVFVFQCLHYFYWLSPLLLLPMIPRLVVYVLLQFYYVNLSDLEENVIIDYVNPNQIWKARFVPDYIPPSYIRNIDDYIINYYLPVKCIPELFKTYIEKKQQVHKVHLDVVICILYLIGWCNILFIYMNF